MTKDIGKAVAIDTKSSEPPAPKLVLAKDARKLAPHMMAMDTQSSINNGHFHSSKLYY